jgi:hypothetical protein
MSKKILRRSFLVPIGYEEDDTSDCRIEALLPASATITRIAVKQRRGVTLAKITFAADAEEAAVPRRFLMHDVQLVKAGKPFHEGNCPMAWVDDDYDLYGVQGLGSFVDASGNSWWIFEDRQFADEVVRDGVDLATIELQSEAAAVRHLCLLTIPEDLDVDQVVYVFVSGFSDEAVDEYVSNNGLKDGSTFGVLEYLPRLRRIALV